jgi:hypothetical protein
MTCHRYLREVDVERRMNEVVAKLLFLDEQEDGPNNRIDGGGQI